MKNNLLLIFLIFLITEISLADDISIQAGNIRIDKTNQTSIFEKNVIIKDKQNVIKSDFAKYDKLKNFFVLRKNIILEDKNGHKFYGDYATYDENEKVFITVGKSNIITSEGYKSETEDIVVNIKKGLAFSKKKSSIEDLEEEI